MKATERDHIDQVGEDAFEKATALAMFEIRKDARFVGLDKIRNAVAFEAALQATGFMPRPLVLPENCGEGLQDTQIAAEEVLAKAIEAARIASAFTE